MRSSILQNRKLSQNKKEKMCSLTEVSEFVQVIFF